MGDNGGWVDGFGGCQWYRLVAESGVSVLLLRNAAFCPCDIHSLPALTTVTPSEGSPGNTWGGGGGKSNLHCKLHKFL